MRFSVGSGYTSRTSLTGSLAREITSALKDCQQGVGCGILAVRVDSANSFLVAESRSKCLARACHFVAVQTLEGGPESGLTG